MVKFSPEEKVEVVRRYLDGNDGVKRLARSIKVHPSVIQQWVKQYKAVGEKAFEKRYTSYSLQSKLDVLNYMDKQGTSIRGTASIVEKTHAKQKHTISCPYGQLIYIIFVTGSQFIKKCSKHF